MHHAVLRLFVALLTFGVGIAASSLFNFNPARKGHRCAAPAAVLVSVPAQDTISFPHPTPGRHQMQFSDGTWINGGVLNGKAVSQPEPLYPAIAKAARAQGTVVVQVVVDENGDVISAQAVSGYPLLQAAAVEAARQAKLSPTFLSGHPVKVTGTLTYNFALE